MQSRKLFSRRNCITGSKQNFYQCCLQKVFKLWYKKCKVESLTKVSRYLCITYMLTRQSSDHLVLFVSFILHLTEYELVYVRPYVRITSWTLPCWYLTTRNSNQLRFISCYWCKAKQSGHLVTVSDYFLYIKLKCYYILICQKLNRYISF